MDRSLARPRLDPDMRSIAQAVIIAALLLTSVKGMDEQRRALRDGSELFLALLRRSDPTGRPEFPIPGV